MKDTLKRRQAQKDEHEQWRFVCAELLKHGAVTKADLEAPVGSVNTPGEFLLTIIRAWGEKRAILGVQ